MMEFLHDKMTEHQPEESGEKVDGVTLNNNNTNNIDSSITTVEQIQEEPNHQQQQHHNDNDLVTTTTTTEEVDCSEGNRNKVENKETKLEESNHNNEQQSVNQNEVVNPHDQTEIAQPVETITEQQDDDAVTDDNNNNNTREEDPADNENHQQQQHDIEQESHNDDDENNNNDNTAAVAVDGNDEISYPGTSSAAIGFQGPPVIQPHHHQYHHHHQGYYPTHHQHHHHPMHSSYNNPWAMSGPGYTPYYHGYTGGYQGDYTSAQPPSTAAPPPPGYHHYHHHPGYPPSYHHHHAVNAHEYREFLAWQQQQQQQQQHRAEEEEEEADKGDEASGTEEVTGDGGEQEGVADTVSLAAAAAAAAGGSGHDDNGDQEVTGTKQKKRKKKNNENDAIKSLILLQNESINEQPLDTPWADMVTDCELVCPALRGDIPDSLYVAIGQFKPVGLTQDDRVGKYKSRDIGFVGMCCKHCGGQPGFGRYFPGSYDSFLNGTNCDGIIKHIKSECRVCPQRISKMVAELEEEHKKQQEQLQMSNTETRPRYGSRKRFFSYVWTKLRQTKIQNEKKAMDEIGGSNQKQVDNDDSNDIDKETLIKLEGIVKDSNIVNIKDRNLVSDVTLIAMAQMMITRVTNEDKIGRCKDHKIGFKGLCCKHCGGKAGKPGYGRYFPSSLRSLAQADSCQQIIKHITSKCTKCPPDVRTLIQEMHKNEDKTNNTEQRIKYGARKIFFRRVWSRLHGEDDGIETIAHDAEVPLTTNNKNNIDNDNNNFNVDTDVDWKRIIGENEVVEIDDRGLISDAQLAAIAQMKCTTLTESDRVGWFKNRKIGFAGLCCKHCGGRPSFGRYFPNSVRSFQQTTSSQTIMSHVAMYCTEIPKDIRDTIVKLQTKETCDETNIVNNMYGSRKIFFDRVWKRIHGTDPEVDESDDATDEDVTTTKSKTAENVKEMEVEKEAGKGSSNTYQDSHKSTETTAYQAGVSVQQGTTAVTELNSQEKNGNKEATIEPQVATTETDVKEGAVKLKTTSEVGVNDPTATMTNGIPHTTLEPTINKQHPIPTPLREGSEIPKTSCEANTSNLQVAAMETTPETSVPSKSANGTATSVTQANHVAEKPGCSSDRIGDTKDSAAVNRESDATATGDERIDTAKNKEEENKIQSYTINGTIESVEPTPVSEAKTDDEACTGQIITKNVMLVSESPACTSRKEDKSILNGTEVGEGLELEKKHSRNDDNHRENPEVPNTEGSNKRPRLDEPHTDEV